MIISEKLRALGAEAERELGGIFADIDRISEINTEKVLDAFREAEISESHFAPSTGYGYGDRGRDAVDAVATRIFGGEAGFMRPSIISGTHALTVGLFALLRPGDVMLSVTGRPYDTLTEVIGIDCPNGDGSLADFGVKYEEIPLSESGEIDLAAVRVAAERLRGSLRVVFIQRSKGYLSRPTLTVSQIRSAAHGVREIARSLGVEPPFVAVDNCYGEFTETTEPCFDPSLRGEEAVDMVIGSLIKNPGGGMADTGGYIIGSKRAAELAGYRLCCPGVGLDAGASLGQNRNILKGLFYAPHTVAQAMKTAHLAAYVFSRLGYRVSPGPTERRSDIIQTVDLGELLSGDPVLLTGGRPRQPGALGDARLRGRGGHGGGRLHRRLLHRAVLRRAHASAVHGVPPGRAHLGERQARHPARRPDGARKIGKGL